MYRLDRESVLLSLTWLKILKIKCETTQIAIYGIYDNDHVVSYSELVIAPNAMSENWHFI